ncbi:aldo/keto reductase [Spirochaeta dissipatitropha]
MDMKRTFGKTGLEMLPIGVGLWAVGGGQWGETNDNAALRMLDAAVDRGLHFYDTADVYGEGHSERLLGKSMKGRRDKFIVATKIGWIGFDGEKGQSAYDTVDKLIAGVESNLKRLDTDYIDIMQYHVDFREPNMEVFLEGCARLVEQGKLRAFGVSTSNYSYLQAFNQNGDCSSLQIDYSILNRTPEADCLPYASEQKIGTIIRGGLAMGILTGKFSKETTFPDNDFRQAWITDPDQNKIFKQDIETVEKLKKVLEIGPKGQTLAQLALRFLLANPDVSMVIPGGRNTEQLEQNLTVLDMPPMSEEELQAINAIVPPKGGRKIWPA